MGIGNQIDERSLRDCDASVTPNGVVLCQPSQRPGFDHTDKAKPQRGGPILRITLSPGEPNPRKRVIHPTFDTLYQGHPFGVQGHVFGDNPAVGLG